MNLLILNYEYPPLGGGAGIVTKYHAEGLAKSGYNATVITTWFEGEPELEEKGNLKIIRLKSKRKYTFKSNPYEMYLWTLASKNFLAFYCNDNKFDLCFAHFSLPGGSVALWLKKRFEIPYFIFSHGHDIPWFFPKQMFLYHLVTYFWIKRICLNSEKNVLHTNDIKVNADKLVGIKLSDKNIVVPNGCDTSIFKPDYSIVKENFKIIFIGRLVKQKDPFTFLKAILLYSKINDNFVVHVLGDGICRKKMEKFVLKNNLEKYVKFFGWVSKAKMIMEYQSASLQIAPSLVESMSISILESLFCGLYVIATPASGNKDFIVKNINGEIVDFKDYKKIAEKINDFYLNKFSNKYKMPEVFLNNFREKHDWNTIIKQFENILIKNKVMD